MYRKMDLHSIKRILEIFYKIFVVGGQVIKREGSLDGRDGRRFVSGQFYVLVIPYLRSLPPIG